MERQGEVRDAIFTVLDSAQMPLTVSEIEALVCRQLGITIGSSSIRSSLQLQAKKENGSIVKVSRGLYAIRADDQGQRYRYGNVTLTKGDAFVTMASLAANSIQAIVTDPPYGLVEYNKTQVTKLRSGSGGVWRIPPSFDGSTRNPLPRFTTLSAEDRERITSYFETFGKIALRILVPGANVVVASNPLVCHLVAQGLESAGLEPRGQLIRLVQTMRGGDRPKGFESKYDEVSVMPRSQFEPWIVMRKPVEGTVGHNLEKYGTGGWRRLDDSHPFGDVIKSSPTRREERLIANHPSLKPQRLMRQIVRAALPLGTGTVLDPFAGSGSTLAAAEALGYRSLGVEKDEVYFKLACESIPRLAKIRIPTEDLLGV